MGGTKALKQQLGAFLKAKQDKEKGGVTKVDKKLQKKK